jgi:hypothetical protein
MKPMQKLYLMPLLAVMILLSGCASPQVGRVVQTPPAEKPLIPASVRTLPEAATVNIEDLILRLVGGSETTP